MSLLKFLVRFLAFLRIIANLQWIFESFPHLFQVSGVITRINLARFREESVKGKFKLEELEVFDH